MPPFFSFKSSGSAPVKISCQRSPSLTMSTTVRVLSTPDISAGRAGPDAMSANTRTHQRDRVIVDDSIFGSCLGEDRNTTGARSRAARCASRQVLAAAAVATARRVGSTSSHAAALATAKAVPIRKAVDQW